MFEMPVLEDHLLHLTFATWLLYLSFVSAFLCFLERDKKFGLFSTLSSHERASLQDARLTVLGESPCCPFVGAKRVCEGPKLSLIHI